MAYSVNDRIRIIESSRQRITDLKSYSHVSSVSSPKAGTAVQSTNLDKGSKVEVASGSLSIYEEPKVVSLTIISAIGQLLVCLSRQLKSQKLSALTII